MEDTNQGLITRRSEVYICPACRQGVNGHFKYKFVEQPLSSGGPQPPVDVPGTLEIVGGVVPEHNCVPSNQREHTRGR